MKRFDLDTDDLIVCANLLFADARTIESAMLDGKALPSSLQSVVDERRALAVRMKEEIEKRTSSLNPALSEAKREAEIQQAILDLFGENPRSDALPVNGDHPVLVMAKDLAYFDWIGVNELAARLGCERGLVTGSSNIEMLQWHADRGQLEPAARIIAENRIGMRLPGRAHTDDYNTRWYHASWDDFISWRNTRRRVGAVCQTKDSE